MSVLFLKSPPPPAAMVQRLEKSHRELLSDLQDLCNQVQCFVNHVLEEPTWEAAPPTAAPGTD